ncbi:MAG: transporter [Filomicrobium sp.]
MSADNSTGRRSRSRADRVNGLGDITLVPAMLAWKSGSWQYSALAQVYAPTGS